jgi:hypothetical protein
VLVTASLERLARERIAPILRAAFVQASLTKVPREVLATLLTGRRRRGRRTVLAHASFAHVRRKRVATLFGASRFDAPRAGDSALLGAALEAR